MPTSTIIVTLINIMLIIGLIIDIELKQQNEFYRGLPERFVKALFCVTQVLFVIDAYLLIRST